MAQGCPLQHMAQQSGSCVTCVQGTSGGCILLKAQRQTEVLLQSLQRIERQLQTLQADVRNLK